MPDTLCIATTNTDPNSNVSAYTQRLCKPWTPSDDLISFLGVWESGTLNGTNFQGHQVTDGLILTAYLDSKGHPTVGKGHLIQPGDHIKVGQEITKERAIQLASQDIKDAVDGVNRRIMVPLFQFEFDALVSLAYNNGPYKHIDDLVKKVNTGEYDKMFDFISKFRAGGGLAYRRYTEAKMFASGVYDATH